MHAQGETNGETARSKERKKPTQISLLRAVERCVCENSRQVEMEQRINMKFCYKLGKTATETHAMLVQVYRTDAVSRKCVYDWFKHFREGKETVDDEPRSGRPSTSVTTDNIERARQMLLQNNKIIINYNSNINNETMGTFQKPTTKPTTTVVYSLHVQGKNELTPISSFFLLLLQ